MAWDFSAKEAATAANRPRLNVTACASPTAAEVAPPQAASESDAIRVSWVSFDERQINGYRLSRSEGLQGSRSLVYQIAAVNRGRNLGSDYEYSDSQVQAGKLYVYWLEVLYKDSPAVLMDPVSATLGIGPGGLYLPFILR